MAEPDGRPTVRYRFGPLHRPGLVAGFRGGQLAAVAGALLLGVGLLRALPGGSGMAAAVLVVGVGVTAAAWPLAGRTAEEWAPDAVHFAARRIRQVRRDGGVFRWTSLVSLSVDGVGPVGVLVDRRRGVHSAVLAVGAPGFLLLGPADRDRRVADWAAVLASVARDRGAVHRLQWLERAVPDDASGHVLDLYRRGRLAEGDPARAAYRQLLDQVGGGSVSHGVLLVVSVRPRRGRGVLPAAGGDASAGAVLLREVAVLRRRLVDAGIECSAPLDPVSLVATIGAAVSPAARVAVDAPAAAGALSPRPADGADLRHPAATGGRMAPGDPGPPGRSSAPVWPWPMATAEEWGRLRTDATWHVTYWVVQWPRTDVPADFLAALLLVGDVRRTVSVVMGPVGPSEAARQVEQARTAEAADTELRRRGGFLATARRQRQAESLAGREAELADGHATFRFCAYVSVTADVPEQLDAACERVEQAAVQAGLELRRCYGDQLRAFVATLPLGAGLP